MAFHFSLETLLRFRQSIERREEVALQARIREVLEARRKIEVIEKYLAKRRGLRSAELAEGMFSAELQFGELTDRALESLRHASEEELRKREAVRDQQREVFHKARADREAVQAIHDHQRQLYRERQGRRAQRALDDLILMRREFLRRG